MVEMKSLYWLIPIVALVILGFIFFRPGGGLYERAAELGSEAGIGKYIPNISIGAEEVTGVAATIPAEHEDAIRSLVKTIAAMKDAPHNACFDQYALPKDGQHSGLPPLGKDGTIIKLSTSSILVSTLGDRQIMTALSSKFSEQLQGFQPCVVAGSTEIVRNFDTFFLNTGDKKQSAPTMIHYNEVEKVIIKVVGNENKIDFGAGFKDLEDYGMLYSPEKGLVCFFPTVDDMLDVIGICDGSSADGLDDDCLGEDPTENIAIPHQLKNGCLMPCRAEPTECTLR